MSIASILGIISYQSNGLHYLKVYFLIDFFPAFLLQECVPYYDNYTSGRVHALKDLDRTFHEGPAGYQEDVYRYGL